MNSLRCLFLLLWIYSLQVFAVDIQPIYQVATQDAGVSNSTYLEATLTHDIYRYSSYADLRNLIVVDVENNPLPFNLVNNAPVEAPQKNISELPFFAVAANITPSDMRLLHNARINVADNNVQIDIADKSAAVKTLNDFYLLDVSHLKQDISALHIDWQVTAKNQYLEVELEASRNLQDWVPLGRNTLVQLQQEQQSIRRNRVELHLPQNTYEFLRLRILQTAEPVQITHVQAEQVDPVQMPENERWVLTGQESKIQSSVNVESFHGSGAPIKAWEFVRNEMTPASSVAINLGDNNYGDTVRIFSRADEKQSWRLQFGGIWFNAQVGNQWKSSDAIKVYKNSDKFWRVEFSNFTFNRLTPELVFEWQPLQIHIITNNKPPYFIAVEQQGNTTQYRQIFNQLTANMAPAWSQVNLVALGAVPELSNTQKNVMEWKKMLFWGLLIAAVFLLLGFAIKLFKQFAKETDGIA